MLNSQPLFDVRAAWKRVERKLDSMTKEERLATLVDAGILTPKGNVRKPYQRLFASRATKPTAASKQ
jgi:hypothetical protein